MRQWIVLAVLLCCQVMMAQTPVADYQVIPMPQQVTRIQCDVPFLLDATVAVVAPDDPVMQRNAQFLCDYVKQSTGITLKLGGTAQRLIVLDAKLASDNPEAYRMTVSPSQVTISGASPAAVFWGIMTLRKALPVGQTAAVMLPAV